MSRNSEDQSEGDGQRGQSELTAFTETTCPVCGRKYDDSESECHPSSVVEFERCLATQNWLFPARRSSEPPPGKSRVLGSDHVSFEPTYLAVRSLINSERFDTYISDIPYQIPDQRWIREAYSTSLPDTDELTIGPKAGIRASRDRIERAGLEATPARVFAHIVFLNQYGLLSGYDPLSRGSRLGLSGVYTKYYDVRPAELESQWIVKRRVDRSKVYSTTPEFREKWGVGLLKESTTQGTHAYSEYKPFDGTAVFDDHRDHNLVVRRVKRDLRRLPNVDWTTAPHIAYSWADNDVSTDSSSRTPVVSFDVAGFEYTNDGQRLRYLGIVTDWEEAPFEVYLQIAQITKTAATGVVVFPNRKHIYDFLHYLKTAELPRDLGNLPEKREEYSSIPNVQALHEQIISTVPVLDEIALLPRRKFLDEKFSTLSNLIDVPTYAQSKRL